MGREGKRVASAARWDNRHFRIDAVTPKLLRRVLLASTALVVAPIAAILGAGPVGAQTLTIDAINSPYSVTGGTSTYADIHIGLVSGDGTLNQSGGTLAATASGNNVRIGDVRAGTLNLSGGTFSGDQVIVGYNTTGTVNQTGGEFVSTGGINVGFTGAGGGSYTISGGTVRGDFYLGAFSSATLTVNGTGLVQSTIVQIGAGASGNGTVHLDGGTISTQRVTTSAGSSTINFNGGTLQAAASTTFMQGLSVANVRDGGAVIDTNGFNIIIAQSLLHSTIGGDAAIDGGLTKVGAGTLILSGANTYTGATIINEGTLEGGVANTFSAASATTVNAGSTLDLGDFAQAINTVSLVGGTLTNGQLTGAITSTGGTINRISGAATLTTASGTTTATGTNSYTGTTIISGGTLAGGATNAFSAASATTVNTGGTLNLGGFAQAINTVALAGGTLTNGSLSGAITSTGGTINGLSGAASLTTTGGTTTVTGVNTFAGPTIVNGGTLMVNGAMTDPVVNAGGTLSGIGSVGDTTVNAGGTFAPGSGMAGTSMTVNGALALQSGATYLVQVDPGTASFANVTGTATLGGANVHANFANGSYIAKKYTILSAGAVQGTFGGLANTNLPVNFNNTLSYDATNVYLNLALNFVPPPTPGYGNGLNANQQNVANTLVNYFNTTGGIPTVFGALNANGLTQVSGETATGSQQVVFDAMNQFMGIMTDPFTAGRGGSVPNALGYAEADALAYASDGRKRGQPEREAYAMFAKAPPKVDEARWNVWAAGFGGSRATDGNGLLGSNNTTSSIYGTAVGADYWFSPTTVAGVSMAGGGTNFSVANGGSGRSDLVQAGAFVRHSEGSAYVTAAAAYGWQGITTDRLVAAGVTDRLHAAFNANAYSGRIEGGHRWLMPVLGGIGFTPYAAAQVTAFDLPAYAETSTNGAATFGLNYAGKTITNTRTELGLRTDKSFAIDGALLTLRGRAAWAHDFNTDRSIAATFQSLPGASFTVNGTIASRDAALTSASAEMKWSNGWAVAATFDGEFSDTTRSYAGKGVVRYAW